MQKKKKVHHFAHQYAASLSLKPNVQLQSSWDLFRGNTFSSMRAISNDILQPKEQTDSRRSVEKGSKKKKMGKWKGGDMWHFEEGLQVTGFPACYHRAIFSSHQAPCRSVCRWLIIHSVNTDSVGQYFLCTIVILRSMQILPGQGKRPFKYTLSKLQFASKWLLQWYRLRPMKI